MTIVTPMIAVIAKTSKIDMVSVRDMATPVCSSWLEAKLGPEWTRPHG